MGDCSKASISGSRVGRMKPKSGIVPLAAAARGGIARIVLSQNGYGNFVRDVPRWAGGKAPQRPGVPATRACNPATFLPGGGWHVASQPGLSLGAFAPSPEFRPQACNIRKGLPKDPSSPSSSPRLRPCTCSLSHPRSLTLTRFRSLALSFSRSLALSFSRSLVLSFSPPVPGGSPPKHAFELNVV